MFRKIHVILFLSLFFSEEAFAQVNLVPNPSFEQLDSCPTSIDQIMYAAPWFQPFVDASGNQQSSSDLYSTCCKDTLCKIPDNFVGTQTPHSGSSYAGIYFYYTSSIVYREYIENILKDTLSNENNYCVQFYISLSDNSEYALTNIGVYFSNDSCLKIVPPATALTYNPQFENTDTTIVKDKANWQPISFTYQAQGGERFMTIGNFQNNTNSNLIYVGGSQLGNYYYIDDVSVIDINTPAYAGIDTTIALGDSVFIGRQPEIGLNEACVWSVNGTPIDTVAGFWVQPDTTTTYVLEQTICGTVAYDTVTVTIDKNVGIAVPPSGARGLVVYPNPATNQFVISLNTTKNIDKVELSINDMTGKEIDVVTLICENNKVIYDKALDNGVYFVTIKILQTGECYTKKMTIID